MNPVLVWFRKDLRLADNPALFEAARRGGPVIPVFVWAPEEEAPWPPGGASRWWLHEALKSLNSDLAELGSRLVLREGSTHEVLLALAREVDAKAVYWNRCYTPAIRHRDKKVQSTLEKEGVEPRIFAERLLHNPDEIKTGAGDPYQVFTPFWRKLKATVEISVPLKSPARIVAPDTWPDSLEVEDLDLTPIAQDGVDWATSMRSYWMPTEVTAQNQLDAFVDELLSRYSEDRNRPDIYGSSSLSPYLHHGLLSPRQVWDRVKTYTEETGQEKSAEVYLSEIGWREFAYHVLWHFPDLPEKPLKEKFESFDWARDSETFHRWQKGLTGYPIVDAGMRQLWALGWMHNRVRMIVGSFLTKHLLVPWQDGEKWFWDTLVDADLANNAMNWQWVAGCGPDAQPFFRIFNPITQGERYDPNGDYVRKWVPELRDVPTSCIHKPWEAPESLLASSGVILGESYPKPVVDHKEARQRALKAYERIK